MKTVKFLIFIIGLFLANYVGGIPQDAKNLFITQTIFFAPYLVDFHPLTKFKSPLRFLSLLIWFAGIILLVANILGITGITTIVDSKVTFNSDYVFPIPLDVSVEDYLLYGCIVYSAVFVGTLTLNYTIAFDQHMMRKKDKKKKQHASSKDSREGLMERVSTR
ncbi:hypothetical protein [Bacillus atrophaeus]|uniref:hypothetical protein n=1 Tax=Bacillus atrophaeus TaxID=1452 RepID=UPI001239AF8E|nr:hypothetical protein [Bacillus atrophaeus]KAA6442374.1 hypothetical protein DX926_20855 [Bacillus atrophaeus]